MRVRWWLILGLAVVGVLVWLWRDARQPAGDDAREVAAPAAPAPRRPTAVPAGTSRAPRARIPTRALPFDPSTRHTADPCSEPVEPVVPAGFEQITEGTITVAWDPAELAGPYDAPLRPVALAHAAAGILEEAAQLTGTNRRERLTVIVDASPDDLHLRTRTPVWVGGLYDGGAVHVPARASADLGVAITTLRHELMHAQIHAAIGCVPFWFNEGLATYFAGATTTHEWIAMLRTGEPFDLALLRDPAILDLRDDNASRLYAWSLAMIVDVVRRKGEVGLREAVRVAQTSDEPLALWEQTVGRLDGRALLESLATAVFGLPLGPELDEVLRGSICCRNLRQPAALACGPPSAEPPARRALCRRW